MSDNTVASKNSRAGLQQVSTFLPIDTAKTFKILCIKRDEKVSAVLEKLVQTYIEENTNVQPVHGG